MLDREPQFSLKPNGLQPYGDTKWKKRLREGILLLLLLVTRSLFLVRASLISIYDKTLTAATDLHGWRWQDHWVTSRATKTTQLYVKQCGWSLISTGVPQDLPVGSVRSLDVKISAGLVEIPGKSRASNWAAQARGNSSTMQVMRYTSEDLPRAAAEAYYFHLVEIGSWHKSAHHAITGAVERGQLTSLSRHSATMTLISCLG